jgi:ankyrin repeat protein
MQRFHYLVQRQILFALEDFCGFKPIPEGPQILPIIYEDMLLYEDAIWTVFNCYLLGIGTDPSPETALDVLYHSGLPENGRLWKSWIIIGPLYKALRIKLPEERTVHVAAMSINGKLGSEFHQIVLSGEEPYEHKVAKFHGIELSQEQFRQLGTRDADHSLDRNVSAHAELGDTEVGGGNTLLHASAFYDDAMMARHLIRNGLVDIDATNDLGETALLIACQYNSYDVLDLLLTNGVDASITDKGGQNGLCWLTSLPQQSTENIARRLVENGARLSWMVMDVHRSENTELFPQSFLQHGRVSGGPLLQAIARRDLHSVKILLQICIESYDKPIILPGALFAQPLRLAADLHLFEILEFLCRELFKVLTKIVGKEITPNMVGGLFLYITKTSSVLRGAVRMGQHVYRLCYHREEWKEAVRKTMGVLHQFGFVTQSMAVFNTMERTLNTAIGAGNYEIVKELLEHQKILDQIDDADEDHFDTPLNKALNSRRLDIVQLLVEKGATVDLRKKRDPKHKLSGVEASYLHVIASLRIENNDFAELLLEQGVPPDVKDNQGSDAFGLALCRCSFNLCRLLLSCGYNLRAPGLFGLTVLGQRFHEQLAKQHDDIYEAVKYVLPSSTCGALR